MPKKTPDERLKGLAERAETKPPPEQHPIAKIEPNPLSEVGGIVLRTLAEMQEMAKVIQKSRLAPKGMDTEEQIIIAMQMGYDVGLPFLQAVQSIAVFNGRPTMWGDALLGLVLGSGKMAWKAQRFEGEGDDLTAIYTTQRKGDPKPIEGRFSVADARAACLWGKTNRDGSPSTWKKYPTRMLANRARAFCLRDNFADVLRGLSDRQEVLDYIPVTAEVNGGTSGVAALAERVLPNGGAEPVEHIEPVEPGEEAEPPAALPDTVPNAVIEEFDATDPQELDELWQLACRSGGDLTETNFIAGLKKLGPDSMRTKMEVRIEKNAAKEGE